MEPEKQGPGGTGKVREASGSVVAQSAPDQDVTKVIIAVHGVGDQYSFATIQSVVNQFCHFHGQPAAIPLGHFHRGKGPYSISPPLPKGPFDHLAFAEVYWAKVPREVVDDQHTMEEAKQWATTLVERLRLSWKVSPTQQDCRNADFDRIKLVLEEMIQTLAVVERLCYLADRAGLFTFDLKKLLEDYLGDVQIVAEFDDERRKILSAFDETLAQVHRVYPAAEVFLIAHSEGTVISFLALLEAGRKRHPPAWLDQVRGFMTLGSPIDKHLILWPDLFKAEPISPAFKPRQKILWRNYYDRGDPIGFELDGARHWLAANGWDAVFSFTKEDDFGFVRYPFPGKAHVDYWKDPVVFGHFIKTVVEAPANAPPKTRPPGSLQVKKWLSYVLPYLGVTALMFLGVFILYKAVTGALPEEVKAVAGAMPKEEIRSQEFAHLVHLIPGITLLLLGITLASRIPRLSRGLWSRLGGLILGLLLAYLGVKIGEGMGPGPVFITRVSSEAYLIAALALVGVMTVMGSLFPAQGLKLLIYLGTAAIAGFVIVGLVEVGDNLGPVWPVFLATGAFLYLWWLAALLLDLILVWHFHIRRSKVREVLATLAGRPLQERRLEPRSPLTVRLRSHLVPWISRAGRSPPDR